MMRDIKYALRALLRSPGFTALALLSLGLGIGANTAIFSVVNAVILQPPAYEDPEELVQIWVENPTWDWHEAHMSSGNFVDVWDRATLLDGVAAYTDYPSNYTLIGGGEPERISAGITTANYFDVLGRSAEIGRTFLPEENWSGNDAVVVLDHGFWQRRFGGDPGIVNQDITLNGSALKVIGVMPADFEALGGEFDLWSPFGWDPATIRASESARKAHNRRVVARLKDGVSVDQARAELTAIASQLRQEHPEINEGEEMGMTPLQEWLIGDTRKPLLILLAAVAVVLLIACANLANLLLMRNRKKLSEVAVRSALGAGRGQIVRQMLVESLLLSGIGGFVGLFLGVWGVRALVPLGSQAMAVPLEASLDWRVVLFTLLVAGSTSVLFGVIPALEISRVNVSETLKEGIGRTTGFRADRARSLLIVAEVALAVLLVVGSGLLIKSLMQLRLVDTGFEAERLLTFKLSPPSSDAGDEGTIGFYRTLLTRSEGLAGVESTAASSILRLSGERWTSSLVVSGRQEEAPDVEVHHVSVTPGYFETMGIEVVDGRAFDSRDSTSGPKSVLVNERLAQQFFRGSNPLGARVTFSDSPTEEDWWTVVGVVENERQESLAQDVAPEVYRPHTQWPLRTMNVIYRTRTEPLGVIGGARQLVGELAPDLPIYDVRTMEQVMSDSLARERFLVWLLTVFAALALVQAAIGIYGVIGYTVNNRSREIGIRMALGAHSQEVVRMVLRQGMILVAIGVLVGVAGALFATRALSTLLYEVSTLDPLVFVGVVVFLAGIGFVATYLPARRATRVQPVAALRTE